MTISFGIYVKCSIQNQVDSSLSLSHTHTNLLKLQANQIHESWEGKNILNLSMLYFAHLQTPADEISCSKLICKYRLFGTHTIL